jgi:hypothetical protein
MENVAVTMEWTREGKLQGTPWKGGLYYPPPMERMVVHRELTQGEYVALAPLVVAAGREFRWRLEGQSDWRDGEDFVELDPEKEE